MAGDADDAGFEIAMRAGEAAVFDLVLACGERYEQSKSSRDRDAFITGGTWLLERVSADPDVPPDDDDLVFLRTQVAYLLNDRADARDGDRIADLTAAIAHYEALLLVKPVGQPDRAELLAFLVDAHFDLMGAVGSTDELVDGMTRHALEAWSAPGLPEDTRGVVGFCLGIGLLEQFSRPARRPAWPCLTWALARCLQCCLRSARTRISAWPPKPHSRCCSWARGS